jgi:hypothetical protein
MPMPSQGYSCTWAALHILKIKTGYTLSMGIAIDLLLLPHAMPFDLYLLSSQDFDLFHQSPSSLPTNNCDIQSISSIHPFFQGRDQSAYMFNFTSPIDDDYQLLIVNRNIYAAIAVTVYMDVIIPYSVTNTKTRTYSVLQTTEILQTSETLVPVPSPNASWLLPVVVVVVVVVLLLVVVGFFATRLGKKRGQVKLTEFVSKTPTCVKCGATLPPDSNFCSKCGSAQD